MQEFVVSLTTIPSRFKGLEQVLTELSKQTARPTYIQLNIPKQYNNPKFCDIPTELIPAGFKVHRCTEDWGPATKILPTVQAIGDDDMPIIYIDDDRKYHPKLFETLLAQSEKSPNKVIAASTVTVKRQIIEAHWKQHPKQYRMWRIATAGIWNPKRTSDYDNNGLIAEGYGGVLVKASFFPETAFKYPSHLRSVDDVWISANMEARGHAIERLDTDLKNTDLIAARENIGVLDALLTRTESGMDRFQANETCIRYVQNTLGVWRSISI